MEKTFLKTSRTFFSECNQIISSGYPIIAEHVHPVFVHRKHVRPAPVRSSSPALKALSAGRPLHTLPDPPDYHMMQRPKQVSGRKRI